MPILGERFYQMSNAIFCYDLKPIPLAVYSYLVCCAGQKELCWPSIKTIALHCTAAVRKTLRGTQSNSWWIADLSAR